ncbi:MAG: CheY-P-specific phosphatase CheC [Firmicutes bacterium]|nr:CheY-P-specific phosphatase CheC [Bacillota bacterium]
MELKEYHRDLLAELANIGAGNAATALSKMLQDLTVTLMVPEVKVAPLQDVPESLGDPEQEIAAVLLEADSDEISLTVVLALTGQSISLLFDKLLPRGYEPFGEIGRSLLMELGNILVSSYLGALSTMTGFVLKVTPPSLGLDMAGALLGSVIADKMMLEDSFILIKTTMRVHNEDIEGNLLLLPETGSLEKIYRQMGVY